MKLPTFSKPKRKLCPSEINNRRDYKTTFTVRKSASEYYCYRVPAIEPIQSIRSVWDESPEAEADLKQWLSANNLNDKVPTVKRRYAKKAINPSNKS
jgi:hypothetical protein